MKAIDEFENNKIKIIEFLLDNLLKLQKENKIAFAKVVVNNKIIYLDVDGILYIIVTMMDYKKVIDNLSVDYRTILKYIPKITSNKIIDKIKSIYYSNNMLNILLIKDKVNIY